ncbi:FtsX-like permease family protein [Xylanimonas allomyrinae]|uniref:FtsX-like permease family protein n=1 Tax=Xylanimonas allomyrinae TaxID=2509459 RepID=A0A4P6EPF1_9MICO|nr:FtsX-like permease family protein [Xylanimonas allomyrinae]QAY64346.1 FtsX-like permease family protein [Xylanimonas allomyrinae]
MKPLDVIRRAFANAFRSRLRTTLTVVAIVIGAFTLTLTNAIGAGVNSFVDDTVASLGVDDVMTVMRANPQADAGSGPARYDPDQVQAGGGGFLGATAALTDADLDTIAATEGVQSVRPMLSASLDYVQHESSDRFQLTVRQMIPGMHVELAAGEQLTLDGQDAQLILPSSYVDPLGFADDDAAIGATVTLALTDATGTQVTTTATVVGVAEPGLVAGTAAVPNEALLQTLSDLQAVGRPASVPAAHVAAMAWFDAGAGTEATQALQDSLAGEGFTATTLTDQLGAFTSVIDTIVLILNGFAIIALVAASIGIVNTLFMAVQERTREVGLMKAMGLSSAKVFSLFSVEAVVIGLLGSAIGVVLAFATGEVVQAALSGSILADLPGLQLVLLEPGTVALVVVGVMAIAFLAGTLPALRAAKQDPISSLRYE